MRAFGVLGRSAARDLTATLLARIRSGPQGGVIQATGGIESQQVGASSPVPVGMPGAGWRETWLGPVRRRRWQAYGVGPGLDDALRASRRLASYGIASAVGYSPTAGKGARHTADVHLAAFERLSTGELDAYVSVKLSTLDFDGGLLAELDAAAARSGRRLHLDALAPETVDSTWRLLEETPRDGQLGTSFPGRWRRSTDDAERAARLGFVVRVVKGQWKHGADGDVDPREGFLDVIDRLCGRAPAVAVGTHDVALLTEAVRRLQAAGTPCEVELLYGLPFRAPALAARQMGVPVRVYVPYGHVAATYGIADIRRTPVAAWWLAQDLLLGKDKTWWSIRRSHIRP
jgi:proline dehydrogenase